MTNPTQHAPFAVIAALLVGVAQTDFGSREANYIALGASLLLLLVLIMNYMARWEVARPDEWQLLIHNGHLVSSGVGARHFRGFFDRVVRFPASIQKVAFTFEQVTSEMQGVVVSGFALWSVHRERNGPWRAYANLGLRDLDGDGISDSQAGNQHIRDMVQSIIRVQIAHESLNSCLTKRDEIRDAVREAMMKQLPGWGVWLETVEISDVRVASAALFNDLQAEFRSSQRLTAERVKLATQRRLEEEQIQADLAASQRKAEAEASKAIAESEQCLKREKKQAELLESTEKVHAERMERQKAMRLAELEADHAVAMRKQQNAALAAAAAHEAELALQRSNDQRLAGLSDRQVQIMQIEATRDIYKNVGSVKINSFAGGGNPVGIIPGLAALAQNWDVVSDTAAE